jgi:hypothetical protein
MSRENHVNTSETITQVLVSRGNSSLSARLQAVEIQNFSITDVSNAFRELVEERLETDLDTTDDDVTQLHSNLQEVMVSPLPILLFHCSNE